MAPQKINLPHLPPTLPLYISGFTDVTNAAYLRQQLLSSNQAYNYTFLDARSVLSTRHLLAACFRALTDQLHATLKSNNVHAEIVFGLSANNNIGDAFRRFGISDASTDVIVVKVGGGSGGGGRGGEAETETELDEVTRGLEGKVEGVEVAGDELDAWLARTCDLDLVRKNYKLGKPPGPKKGVVNGVKAEDGAVEKTREREEIERVVLGLMALRGAT